MSGWALEQAPHVTGHSSKPDRAQGAFRQYSWAPAVTCGDGPLQGQELDLMILVGPLQLSIFCNSVIPLIPEEPLVFIILSCSLSSAQHVYNC